MAPTLAPDQPSPRIGLVDFFSGCGGTSLGFEQAGMRVLAGVDEDPAAAATFKSNFPSARFELTDIRHLTAASLDRSLADSGRDYLVVAGCAPCQPFSKQRTSKPEADDRRPLLLELQRFIRRLRPEVIVVENVPGLQKATQGEGPFREFTAFLEKLRYCHATRIVRAEEYGVPQHRRRLILIASRIGDPGFPDPTHGPGRRPYLTVREAIGGLPPIGHGEEHPTLPNHRAAALSDINLERIRATPEGGDRRSWPRRLISDCHRGAHAGHTDVYGRMSWDALASGLTTRCISYSNGRYGHPEQDRAISIREAAYLQTFPREFEFSGNMTEMSRQIGNAVPVALARAIGNHLVQQLGDHFRSTRT